MASRHLGLLTGVLICMLSVPAVAQVSAGWKMPFNGSASEPVVHDGTLYIGSFDGSVYAIDPRTGKPIWQHQTGVGLTSGPEVIVSSGKSFQEMAGAALSADEKKRGGKREVFATPVIENGTVYIGSRDFKFYALDAKTGKMKWATDIDHPISRKALIAGETILVHGAGPEPFRQAIYALHKEDGRVVWSTKDKLEVSYPSASGNVAYYARRESARNRSHSDSEVSFVDAVEISTGKTLWTHQFRGDPPDETLVSSDLVYVSSFRDGGMIRSPDNKAISMVPSILDVIALRASSGEPVWKFTAGPFGFSRYSEFLEAQDNLYFVARPGLYAVNKRDGRQEWFLPGTFSQSGMAMGDSIFVRGDSSENDDRVYAVDKKTGKVAWSYRDQNLFFARVEADTLYISAERSLVALHTPSGKVLWKFKTGSLFKEGPRVSAAAVVFDNHVIFPTETNVIWGRDSIQGQLYSVNRKTGEMGR